jgi:2-phosphoglycerate kinase
MSRILTLIKVNEEHAVKITLEIKKAFVRTNQTEVSQEQLEQILFQKLQQFGYGEKMVSRYNTVTRFYQKKIPFIIIVCGTRCMGKSTLITQLADLVNISNILQTKIVSNVMSQFLPNMDLLKSKHNSNFEEQDRLKQKAPKTSEEVI